jgi:hypothetical protein
MEAKLYTVVSGSWHHLQIRWYQPTRLLGRYNPEHHNMNSSEHGGTQVIVHHTSSLEGWKAPGSNSDWGQPILSRFFNYPKQCFSTYPSWRSDGFSESRCPVYLTLAQYKWQSTYLRIISKYDHAKTKLHGLSPQMNYTDRATAACRRS